MAYDPEARESSNTAMIIGIVALVLVVGAVLAYYATRDNDPEVVTTNPTTVVREEVPANNTVVVAPSAPSTTVIERPVAVPQTRTIERNTNTTTTRVIPAPSGSAARPSGGSSGPNVTTNVNVQPPAGGTSGSGTSGGGASIGTASGGAASTAPVEDTATAPADSTASTDLPAPATP